jgi:hypothetical protein
VHSEAGATARRTEAAYTTNHERFGCSYQHDRSLRMYAPFPVAGGRGVRVSGGLCPARWTSPVRAPYAGGSSYLVPALSGRLSARRLIGFEDGRRRALVYGPTAH